MLTLMMVLAASAPALAGTTRFQASIDRAEISMDEAVALRLVIEVEGGGSAGSPSFHAPAFDVINEYTSNSVQSFYENGRFGMRTSWQVNKILRPKSVGEHTIDAIQVEVAGQVHKADPIRVKVSPGGAGTPPPKLYGGAGSGLRGGAKRASGHAVFVRAEVSKDRLYKGEQLVVSYYLYRRTRVFNVAVDKYPVLNGFLREDMEIPVMGPTLQSEQVMLDGGAYERSLLVRYAAYPLKEGPLTIDPLGLKVHYYAQGPGGGDDDDPFMNLFQQLAPRSVALRSDPLKITALPWPEDGRPTGFNGGVGEFSVAMAVNKYEVRVNEPITLTVKVEGRGNLSSLELPRTEWPTGIEQYESKGRAKSGPGGIGEKIFEILLIPRAPGVYDLPEVRFAFLNPASNQYEAKSTQGVKISVSGQADPALGQAKPDGAGPEGGEAGRETGTKPAPPEGATGLVAWARTQEGLVAKGIRFVGFAGGAGALALIGLFVGRRARRWVANSRARASERQLEMTKSFRQLEARARAAREGAAWNEVLATYEALSGAVFDSVDRVIGEGARALSRGEISARLLEKGVAPETCAQIEKVLENAEMVRFAGKAAGEESARAKLAEWVAMASKADRELRAL